MPRIVLLTAALVAFIAAACGGGDDATTTTTQQPTGTTIVHGSVTFGDGVLPDSMPAGFPIPSSAVIGTTMHDSASGRTEVQLRLPAGPEAAVRYFEESLPAAGFEITGSVASGANHIIEFVAGDAMGSVTVAAVTGDVSQVSLRFLPEQ